MFRNLLLPAIVVLIIVGGILFMGSGAQKKNGNAGTNQGTSISDSVSSEESIVYFDENAKVMFFYREECSWCEKEKTVLAELGTEGYRVKPMDIGKDESLWEKYGIEGTPTFIASDGTKLVGYKEKDELKNFLDKYK